MRGVVLMAGAVVLAAAWTGPLPQLAQQSFTAHMAMHLAVVVVAAPLLAFGLAGTAMDPVNRSPAVFSPVPVSLLELVVIWVWHTPALHRLARHNALAMAAEQAAFLAVALALWLSVTGGRRYSQSQRSATGVVALLLTTMHMTFLGTLLALAPRPLYSHPDSAAAGRAALEDQQLGGVLMLLGGGSVYLIAALYLLNGLLKNAALHRGGAS